MATEFNYSIANDTLNGAAEAQALTNDIRVNINITIALLTVKVSPGSDNIFIKFKTNISASEETELIAVVAAHTGKRAIEDPQKFHLVSQDGSSIAVDKGEITTQGIDLPRIPIHMETDATLVGPQGPQGDVGPQGPAGPAGIFGSEFHYQESVSEKTTTSSSWQLKLSFNTSALPLGNYYVIATAEIRNSSDEYAAMARFLVDGVVLGENGSNFGKDTSNKYEPFVTQGFLSSISGIKTLKIEFREQDGGTARIRRAKITLWRVS